MAALGVLAAPAGKPVFDAHVHIWSDDKRRKVAPTSFTAEELLEHARPQGVTMINLVQMSFYGLDHRYMLEAIRKNPGTFVGTAVVPADSSPNPDATMVAFSKQGIRAFRLRGGPFDHPGYDKMFVAGAKHNLALSFIMRPPSLPEVDRMCTKHPDTPVIVDHTCGIGASGKIEDDEVAAFLRLARHRRVMVKIGAFYAFGAKRAPYTDLLPLIRRVVTAFGPERCMWESDSPFQVQKPHTYAASIALIRDHADFLSSTDKEQILFGTAHRFFKQRGM
jgi:predicted TIM-barrel fold metal-dependent hydrolase